jgi:hypothetical protein
VFFLLSLLSSAFGGDDDTCTVPPFGEDDNFKKAVFIYNSSYVFDVCAADATKLLLTDKEREQILSTLTDLMIGTNAERRDPRIIDAMVTVYFEPRTKTNAPDLAHVLRRNRRYVSKRLEECRNYILEEPMDPNGCPLFSLTSP